MSSLLQYLVFAWSGAVLHIFVLALHLDIIAIMGEVKRRVRVTVPTPYAKIVAVGLRIGVFSMNHCVRAAGTFVGLAQKLLLPVLLSRCHKVSYCLYRESREDEIKVNQGKGEARLQQLLLEEHPEAPREFHREWKQAAPGGTS